MPRTVALTTLGCARNEVDSEELAGRLAADGWALVEDAAAADVIMVNTCGFVDAAKKDSIDTVLAAADLKQTARARAVVAVGCLAERYGEQLASALPEADAVLSFDDYTEISSRLRSILAGDRPVAHVPRDRRTLLPLSPAARRGSPTGVPGHATREVIRGVVHGPVGSMQGALELRRRRLAGGPSAPLKIASGCDRRCAFCAIPTFRGAFVSRTPDDVLAEARWLAGQGVRELVLVSENSTSYGKDLGDLRALEALLPQLAAVDGIEWVRVSYLQPAEMRPSLVDVMTGTPGVVPYFDLSFQHASGPVLRRMRRFGDTHRFLELLATIRQRCPQAGVRTNAIVGFPGETGHDVAELERFLAEARLDAIGVFGYSDEDGTEGTTLSGKIEKAEIRERVERITMLADELAAQRAEDRVGEPIDVLIESVDGGVLEGRAGHQAPEVDGTTALLGSGVPGSRALASGRWPAVGDLVAARVVGCEGVDLVAEPVELAQ